MWKTIANITSCGDCEEPVNEEPSHNILAPKFYKRILVRKPSKAREILRKSSRRIMPVSNKYADKLRIKSESVDRGDIISSKHSIYEPDFKTRFASQQSKQAGLIQADGFRSPPNNEVGSRARGQKLKSPKLDGDMDNTPVFDESQEGFLSFLESVSEESKYECQGKGSRLNIIYESENSEESGSSVANPESDGSESYSRRWLNLQNNFDNLNGTLQSIQEVSNEGSSDNSSYHKKVERIRKYLMKEIVEAQDS